MTAEYKFGPEIRGVQGLPVRYAYMTAVPALVLGPGPLRVLEIGSWVGCSAIAWAEALARRPDKGTVLCVDSWEPAHPTYEYADKPLYNEMNDIAARGESYAAFLHNIALAPVKVNHFRGRARDVLPYLASSSFDIVYIDGSHYAEDVAYDIAQADRLAKLGGIVCGDDLELQLHECDEDVAFLSDRDYVLDPKTGRKYHPGVTVAVQKFFGRVSNFSGFWAMRKLLSEYWPVELSPLNAFVPSHLRPRSQ